MFYPIEEVMHRIREIVQIKFNEACLKWTNIPQETQRMWFEREFLVFQTYFQVLKSLLFLIFFYLIAFPLCFIFVTHMWF